MTDIVERLRREVPHCDDPSDYGESDLLILKAAAEIERLRETLRHYVSECDCNGGTFIWHDDITGKDLVRDCQKCEPARAALGEKE